MSSEMFAKTTRAMLRAVNEVGAKPFILFQYYQTWQNAKEGIFPSLKRVSNDLGITPTAICNLRKRLEEAGWIRIENGRILITKTFTKNEQSSHGVNKTFIKNEDSSQEMNVDSQKMNKLFTKNESLLISKKKESKKNEEEETTFDYPLEKLLEAFPDIQLTPGQLGMMSSEVKDTPIDREAWTSTVSIYKGNHDPAKNSYRPEKFGTLLDVFKKQRDILKNQNGKFKQSQSEREKSADRAVNADSFADELERQGLAERAAEQGLSLGTGPDHR